MTVTYDPYANTVEEKVNSILKDGFKLEKFANKKKLLKEIMKDNIALYNNERLHFPSYFMTSKQMPAQCQIKLKTYQNEISSAPPRADLKN